MTRTLVRLGSTLAVPAAILCAALLALAQDRGPGPMPPATAPAGQMQNACAMPQTMPAGPHPMMGQQGPMAECPMMRGMMGAQPAMETCMPMIGEKAPAFAAQTTHGTVNFPQDYAGKWVVFFSHPSDFTPVCTTEFMTFATQMNDFEAINAKLLGLSIDSKFAHIAWLRTIQNLQYKGMKNVTVMFPVIEDLKMDIARSYGMIQPSASDCQTVRAVFIIDPQATVRAILYYPMTVGRNIDEIKRLVIALQTSDKHKVSLPANWQPGDDVIMPPPGSCGAAAQRVDEAIQGGYTCIDWFLCLKPLPKEQLTLPPGQTSTRPAR